MTSTPVSTAPLQYGPPISLERAKRVVKAAEAEAAKHHWPMVIAIVDSGGHLVLLERMDNAQYGSILIAQQKAETALSFKRATKVFEEALERGGANLRLLGATNLLPLEGGLVLMADGKIAGAIGVSGMQSRQDVQVAQAGADAM
jgi:glc operon protein GlcG